MAQYRYVIQKVTNNGPYSYIIYKQDPLTNKWVGYKAVVNVASITAALNGARDDIAAQLAVGETVDQVSAGVTTNDA